MALVLRNDRHIVVEGFRWQNLGNRPAIALLVGSSALAR